MNMSKSLWEIGKDFEALDAILDETATAFADQFPPEAEAILAKWFEEAQGDLEAKVDGYCSYIGHLEAVAEARRAEAERIAALSKAGTIRAEALRKRLQDFMAARGMRKLETALHKLSICRHGGKQPLLVLIPAEGLPLKYQQTEIKANKDLIREDMESGTPVPGCELLPRGESLRIR
jgi:hypothetical protein